MVHVFTAWPQTNATNPGFEGNQLLHINHQHTTGWGEDFMYCMYSCIWKDFL